jgi:hypothetical protein
MPTNTGGLIGVWKGATRGYSSAFLGIGTSIKSFGNNFTIIVLGGIVVSAVVLGGVGYVLIRNS